jgi:hypothetical protein
MHVVARRWERDALLAFAVAATIRLIGAVLEMFPSSTLEDVEVWECIQCESTNTCRRGQLSASGWETHRLKDGSYVVLCGTCKSENEVRRRTLQEIRNLPS